MCVRAVGKNISNVNQTPFLHIFDKNLENITKLGQVCNTYTWQFKKTRIYLLSKLLMNITEKNTPNKYKIIEKYLEWDTEYCNYLKDLTIDIFSGFPNKSYPTLNGACCLLNIGCLKITIEVSGKHIFQCLLKG